MFMEAVQVGRAGDRCASVMVGDARMGAKARQGTAYIQKPTEKFREEVYQMHESWEASCKWAT